MEVALAVVLLVAAGLMIRSLTKIWGVDPGFDPHNVVFFSFGSAQSLGATPDAIRQSYRQIHDAIAAVPGVDLLAVGPSDLSRSLGIAGEPDHPRLVAAIERVRAAAQQNGSLQFEARITPSGGIDEPVRSFPFYLLSKSYADILKEAAVTSPGANMDAFIDSLEVSKEMKAWMKSNHWVNLAGEDFVKKLKTPRAVSPNHI